MKTKVLMVCLGNICRSPLAEGVLKHLVEKAGKGTEFEIDSAGTANYHIGDPPDTRSSQVAINHGFKLNHRGRQLGSSDFEKFDYILVMDESNYHNSIKLAKNETQKNKVRMMTEFDPRTDKASIVADPYYGTIKDFEDVYQQLVICCEGFLKSLK